MPLVNDFQWHQKMKPHYSLHFVNIALVKIKKKEPIHIESPQSDLTFLKHEIQHYKIQLSKWHQF